MSSPKMSHRRLKMPTPSIALSQPTLFLDINATYNRENLTLPSPNGPNGRRVLNIEMLMTHAVYWDWMNERETQDVLMELYNVRTRRMQ
jgi:hypothetical protein